MPQFTAISRDSHAGKKWQPFKNYGFASTSALAPIVGVEIARAALAMPLAFSRKRTASFWWRCYRSSPAATCW